ncbi:hypothetical protein PsorP6_009798 [Peronosclerospora sorghi]|uniref:Uncharacterized protein n=1 Tax=Peronosclerospora sorghi TaxID=230839 RepID=A0ACC0VZP8_9STRA|nr:hypothetical protein PsorP6_009798 [Peronosclerospora sorghi]
MGRQALDSLNAEQGVDPFSLYCNERLDVDSRLETLTATALPVVSPQGNNIVDVVIPDSWRPQSTSSETEYEGRLSSSTIVKPTRAVRGTASSISLQGAVDLASRRHVGLLVSTFCAGFLNTCVKHSLLPLLEAEMELEKRRVDAASVLVALPWSYAFLWGFLSDAVPFFGTRRKAYILSGWVISMCTCFAMAILNYTLEYNALSSQLPTEKALEHRVALIDGYMVLFMVTSFGYVLTLVIAETYIVAQSRREGLTTRGKALGTLLVTLCIGDEMGQLIADKLVFHITELGLTPVVTFRQVALVMMFSALVPILALILFYHEDPDPAALEHEDAPKDYRNPFHPEHQATSCFERLQLNWWRVRDALAKESTLHVIQFFALFLFLSEFTLSHPHGQLEIWCNFNKKAHSSSNITSQAFTLLTVGYWKYCALNWNWRHGLCTTFVLIVLVPQVVYYFVAIFSIPMRNQEAFSVITGLRGFVHGAVLILELAMSVEIAPVGGEGACVGMILSINTVVRLLSTTFSHILGFFCQEPSFLATQEPPPHQVALALGLCYATQLVSLVALLFLPRQKNELQRLHWYGPQGDTRRTWWVLGTSGGAFLVSAVFNCLAFTPETACLRIVGGTGCTK